MVKEGLEPRIINHVISDSSTETAPLVIATRNENKLKEFARILGIPLEEIVGIDLKVNEIQDANPDKVLDAKAKEAWKKNGHRPIFVEDTSFGIVAWDGLPGPYADDFINSYSKRANLCKFVATLPSNRAIFRVGIAVFDGLRVHKWVGVQAGSIAPEPRQGDSEVFGFDDIFIPDGQVGEPLTNAEMGSEGKDRYSPRRDALEQFLLNPPDLATPIFELPPPYDFQMDAIDIDALNKDPKAIQYAYLLEAVRGNPPRPDFTVDKLPEYYQVDYANGAVRKFTVDPDSSSLGLLVTPIDTAHDLEGNPTRLEADAFGNLIFWQMGLEEVKKALAARAYEFMLFHNDKTYEYLRSMMRGEIVTPQRTNQKSAVIEKMITLIRREEEGEDTPQEDWDALSSISVETAATTSEMAYTRQSSGEYMSRTDSAHLGLILNTTASNNTPSSVFELGGMPPVTGWKDVVVSSALSYTRNWIPHNGEYAENPDLQLRLFHDAVKDIDSLGLPKDIRDLVVKQIGISVGCRNPEEIGAFAKRAYSEGVRAIRIYTTNPDPRVVETALAIREACGDDMFICVGPVVDIPQARLLVDSKIKVNLILWGHGAGENCTSLAGGGAANALELLYLSSIDPTFNDTEIGIEGGTGWSIGALLGFIDKISYNQRMVAGGIEMGGLFVQHSDGTAVQPYHGSASSVTQWLEALFNKKLAKQRLTPAGDLKNVEGKPNYMEKFRSISTIVQHFWNARMYGGRALADQRSHSINQRRSQVNEHGFDNLRNATPDSQQKAKSHRRRKEH